MDKHFYQLFFKKKKINDEEGLFKKEEKKLFKTNGYLVKENFLDNNFINNFLNELDRLAGYWEGDNILELKKQFFLSDIKSTKFFYETNDLLKLENVKQILLNEQIINSARNLLDAEPIINNISCWHSFVSDKPDKQAAQLWHFDMERPKWIKLFFFLTDCNFENGPHCFISESHKNNGIPKNLRLLGYQRLNNELIEKNFDRNLIKEITCSKGSILFEDTRGLHKGKQLLRGHRTIFQIEFVTSMFGAITNKIKIDKDNDLLKRFHSKFDNSDYIIQNFELEHNK